MTSLATSLRSLPKRQAGGPNGAVTFYTTLLKENRRLNKQVREAINDFL